MEQLTQEPDTTKIHYIRGMWIMIDKDLADLYGVETRRLCFNSLKKRISVILKVPT